MLNRTSHTVGLLLSFILLGYNMYFPLQPLRDSTGSISGKVIYEGGSVQKTKNVIKDEHTCGTGDIIDESLLTDENGGLKWAVISIDSKIEGGSSLEFLSNKIVLNQKNCVFEPHIVIVGVNQTITIVNGDKTLHNVRSVSFLNDAYNKVQVYIPGSPAPRDSTVFSETEVVEMVCDVHGWMKAFIHVVDHPYHVITDASGSFKLENVPPGTYTLKGWHEKLGEITQKIDVKPGENTEINLSYKAR